MKNKDLILAIETSCDETGVALIYKGSKVIGMETASSISLHQETKGVIPEVAARAQVEYIMPVLNKVKEQGKVKLEDINAIAVTNGPGLIGSLLIGISTANTLALLYNKDIYGVNHIHGHIYANLLDREINEIKFPNVVLTVSGGHNEIYLWKNINTLEHIGETLDDSSGEAFDKCGRLIGLPYPAGALVSALAEKGNRNAFNFPRGMKYSKDFNFSFSGLKTSFLYKLNELKSINNKTKEDLSASLEEAICDILSEKITKASIKYGAKQIHISGGVSANKRLRELILKKSKLELIYPKKIEYCTDNAAMIGAAAYYQDIICSKFVEVNLNQKK